MDSWILHRAVCELSLDSKYEIKSIIECKPYLIWKKNDQNQTPLHLLAINGKLN